MYKIWKIVKILACCYTTHLYPYYAANEFPGFDSGFEIWILIFFEAIFGIDLVLNFFL